MAHSRDWAFGGGMFRIDCDYRLLIDNLMDLTHETYFRQQKPSAASFDFLEADPNAQL